MEREESLKTKVRERFFKQYKYTQLGNIDFVIAQTNLIHKTASLFDAEDNTELHSHLWAEAKRGILKDVNDAFVQLILTIGKEKTFEKFLPPKFIGAFDAEKIAFLEYYKIQSVFAENDFNWNVAPSNYNTKEFKKLQALCRNIFDENTMLFRFNEDQQELKEFIENNFVQTRERTEQVEVTRNNFTFVYQRWSEKVKPTIDIEWSKAEKSGLSAADFFLADLLSTNNESIKDSLYVVLKKTKYELAKKIDDLGLLSMKTVAFKDNQKAYKQFWNIYKRPPKQEYWAFIISRRDLLISPDIRERKGAYFTPQIWVEKSQQYIADVLGEDWQDEYYVWDCAAGTGNLLNGLTNYRNVWGSTLDQADVDVMKDRIHNGWGMFANHVFQFDFLNDEFIAQSKGGKVPDDLYEIITDAEKREKLVVYINPPYAEAGTSKQTAGTGKNKKDLATSLAAYKRYKTLIGAASNELFALFFARIYQELHGCILAEFSKLKILQGSNFAQFRNFFQAKLEKMFLVPSWTFDNVQGKFPIGFFVWNTQIPTTGTEFLADVFEESGFEQQQKKIIVDSLSVKKINDWLAKFKTGVDKTYGILMADAPDFANQKYVSITNEKTNRHGVFIKINKTNIFPISVYMAVRHCIEHTWLNDREQFLYPNDGWKTDKDFQSNCLTFSLFHGQNRISSAEGTNHWIPFTEKQVGCTNTFKSNFMSNYIKANLTNPDGSLALSKEAQEVYDAGLLLWQYYYTRAKAIPDASFYDIRRFFQGTSFDKKGKERVNNTSEDEEYNKLIKNLRTKMKALAKVIEPKVYEYGFLQ